MNTITKYLRLQIYIAAGAMVLLLFPFTGCEKKTTGTYKEGRVWVVNNLCPYPRGDVRGRWVTVEWEGEVIEIPRNMDYDGGSTGVGAVLITPEPLPGGTEADFVFNFLFGAEVRPRRLSEVLPAGQKAIIDGDITADLFSLKWDVDLNYNDSGAQIVSGRVDDIHHYPDM